MVLTRTFEKLKVVAMCIRVTGGRCIGGTGHSGYLEWYKSNNITCELQARPEQRL